MGRIKSDRTEYRQEFGLEKIFQPHGLLRRPFRTANKVDVFLFQRR